LRQTVDVLQHIIHTPKAAATAHRRLCQSRERRGLRVPRDRTLTGRPTSLPAVREGSLGALEGFIRVAVNVDDLGGSIGWLLCVGEPSLDQGHAACVPGSEEGRRERLTSPSSLPELKQLEILTVCF